MALRLIYSLLSTDLLLPQLLLYKLLLSPSSRPTQMENLRTIGMAVVAVLGKLLLPLSAFFHGCKIFCILPRGELRKQRISSFVGHYVNEQRGFLVTIVLLTTA